MCRTTETRNGARLQTTLRWISVSRNLALGNYESVALPLSYSGFRTFAE
jgi:hypothetical protein